MAIGVPDDIYGEEVVAYVSLKPGAQATAQELMDHCAGVLPAFKTPKEIIIRDSLPQTARGKLDRNALLDEWKRARDAALTARA